MESNCAQCHTEENFAGTAHVDHGRKLFFSNNCYGCHKIEGLSDGSLAPDLSEVGKKFKLDYLWESIVDPRANLATSFMPKFNLSESDVRDLVIFLKSRRGVNFAETSLQRYRAALNAKRPSEETGKELPAPQGAALLAAGEKAVGERACTACHKLGERDGGIAPDLSREGLVRDEEWIFEHFRNPRSRVADSIMPAFRFPEGEFRAITAYLVRPEDAAAHAESGRDLQGPVPALPRRKGRRARADCLVSGSLSARSDQGRLHQQQVAGAAGQLAEERRARTSMRLGPHLERRRSEGRAGVCLRHLHQGEASRSESAEGARYQSGGVQHRIGGAGETMFLARCSGCHGRKADGKGPNSLDILPRPRNLRNSAFVQSVNDRRLFESVLYGVQERPCRPGSTMGCRRRMSATL